MVKIFFSDTSFRVAPQLALCSFNSTRNQKTSTISTWKELNFVHIRKMKIYFTFFLLLTLSTKLLSQADFAPRTILLGGSIGGSYNESTTRYVFNSPFYPSSTMILHRETTSIAATPRVMYFLLRNFAIGAQNQTTFNREKSGSNISKYTTFAYGAVLRYYLSSGIFAQAGAGRQLYISDGTTKLFQAFGGIGYCKMMGPRISIEPTITYTYSEFNENANANKNKGAWKSNNYQFGIGVSLYLSKENTPSN